MANQQLVLVRERGVRDTPEINNTQEELNRKEEQKDDDEMDHLVQAAVDKLFQAFQKVDDSHTEQRCQAGREKHEAQVKLLEVIEKLNKDHIRQGNKALEVMDKQIRDHREERSEERKERREESGEERREERRAALEAIEKQIQGHREERYKQQEVMVKLVENLNQATAQHIEQGHEERGVMVRLLQQQFNIGAFFLGGAAAMFLVA
ncbi:unnamed protein product, partial [Sphagnum compactum]